jgi:Holliday junction DNA helicase RuvA
MYNHFKGKLVEKNPAYVIIECGGVGYYLNISLNTFGKIGSNELCVLYAHQIVREDAHTLYGFYDEEEREIFRKLISVSGVGASTARVVLSSLSPGEVAQAIINEDVNLLKSIKGIGGKTAERIIVDLKDKITADLPDPEKIQFQDNTHTEEALSALVALGFDKSKSRKMLQKVESSEPDLPVEALVKQALKFL